MCEQTQFGVTVCCVNKDRVPYFPLVSSIWQRYSIACCWVSLELHVNKNNLSSGQRLVTENSFNYR